MKQKHSEKRKLDRFDIDAPAWIDIPGALANNRMFEARILNISSKGALFKLKDQKITADARVELTILISVKKLSELFGIDDHVLLRVSGKVLRVDELEAAIEFVGKPNVYSAQRNFISDEQDNIH